MSLARPTCAECSVDRECAHVAWYSSAQRDLFGVAWRCPKCNGLTLTVSPVGPAHVGPETCLQCGAEGCSDTAPCAQCGAGIGAVHAPGARTLPNKALLELAREDFALGTCRRPHAGDYVLQRNPGCEEAHRIKEQFVEHLDAQPPFS